MKKSPILFYLLITITVANSEFHKLWDCEGKWIALTDSLPGTEFSIGFVFMNPYNGLNYHHHGIATYNERFVLKDSLSDFNKKRLSVIQHGGNSVYVLDSLELEKLNLPMEPVWINEFKDKRGPLGHFIFCASNYNHIGASHIAISLLKKVEEIASDNPRWQFEMIYAYNHMGKFDSARYYLSYVKWSDSTAPSLLKEAGFYHFWHGSPDSAIYYYNKQLKFETNSESIVEAYINLARANKKAGNTTHFYELLSKAENAAGCSRRHRWLINKLKGEHSLMFKQ